MFSEDSDLDDSLFQPRADGACFAGSVESDSYFDRDFNQEFHEGHADGREVQQQSQPSEPPSFCVEESASSSQESEDRRDLPLSGQSFGACLSDDVPELYPDWSEDEAGDAESWEQSWSAHDRAEDVTTRLQSDGRGETGARSSLAPQELFADDPSHEHVVDGESLLSEPQPWQLQSREGELGSECHDGDIPLEAPSSFGSQVGSEADEGDELDHGFQPGISRQSEQVRNHEPSPSEKSDVTPLLQESPICRVNETIPSEDLGWQDTLVNVSEIATDDGVSDSSAGSSGEGSSCGEGRIAEEGTPSASLWLQPEDFLMFDRLSSAVVGGKSDDLVDWYAWELYREHECLLNMAHERASLKDWRTRSELHRWDRKVRRLGGVRELPDETRPAQSEAVAKRAADLSVQKLCITSLAEQLKALCLEAQQLEAGRGPHDLCNDEIVGGDSATLLGPDSGAGASHEVTALQQQCAVLERLLEDLSSTEKVLQAKLEAQAAETARAAQRQATAEGVLGRTAHTAQERLEKPNLEGKVSPVPARSVDATSGKATDQDNPMSELMLLRDEVRVLRAKCTRPPRKGAHLAHSTEIEKGWHTGLSCFLQISDERAAYLYTV